MHSAPFWRTADKIGYVFGTITIFLFAFILGRFPHDLFYHYYTFMILLLLVTRVVHFFQMGWQYYLIDFCYYANFIILYCLNFGKGNDLAFKVSYLFANGVLARSVWVFRNSLVLHRVDILTSLAIHLFPFICMYHFKWFTLEEDQKLPLEQRRFVTPIVEDNWTDYFKNMFIVPIAAYWLWLVNYAAIMFVVARKHIKEKNYHTLYLMVGEMKPIQDLLKKKKLEWSPPLFMLAHFTLFFVCHLGAVIAYHSFWWNTFIVCLYSYVSVWNGACFYMDFFSKKYDKLLSEYEKQFEDVK